MLFHKKTWLLCLTALLSAYTSQPHAQTADKDGSGKEILDHIRQSLPGSYSNLAQVNKNGGGRLATDLHIRQIFAEGEPVFIFESQQRGSWEARFDIYWLKLNPQTQQPEFHFAHLSGSELSLSRQETLATAWKRVLPGCVITLEGTANLLQGHSQPDTCRFEDPIHGQSRIYRMLALGNNNLQLETIMIAPGDEYAAGSNTLSMLKHQLYTGSVSMSPDTAADTPSTGEWRQSGNFNMHDDGRINRLYDSSSSMGFAIQLARLYRHQGESPSLKISIINLENNGTQAFQWFEPGSEQLQIDLDWIKVKLEPAKPDESDQ